jgi:hypothetical protein
MPARSASIDMPSTCVRLRIVRSRSAGRHGAIVKPQLPITAVVTPSAVDGEQVGSQVICASKWVWLSTMPGHQREARASTTRRAATSSRGATPTMRPASTATSPARLGAAAVDDEGVAKEEIDHGARSSPRRRGHHAHCRPARRFSARADRADGRHTTSSSCSRCSSSRRWRSPRPSGVVEPAPRADLEGPLAIATVTGFAQRFAGKGVPVNEDAPALHDPRRGRRWTCTCRARAQPRRTRWAAGALRHDPADPQRFLIVGDDHAHRRAPLVVAVALATDALILVLIGLYLAGVIDLR